MQDKSAEHYAMFVEELASELAHDARKQFFFAGVDAKHKPEFFAKLGEAMKSHKWA